ncbi:flavin reductase family protein [Subtercola sp. PAMC28395]|uniref:flavin reductase family protein n=1 Tax=Subtercola sp. PAMC28395 TaxID=2846775 RepID=UPI001C0B11B6|nr:flavin reductase family protein [Subtercola sp. PAMC28395]QWT24404.1 flavin reductase family protein [Subtercola sp. PAMC28395]
MIKENYDPLTEAVLSADEFKNAFRDHPAGVAVITADAGDGPVALTATSVASVSAEPPLIMFSVSAISSSTPTIRRARTVVVHLLSAEQLHIAKLGATSGVDRFADRTLWDVLPTGETYFPQARTWIRARVLNQMQAGGSSIVLVEALEAKPQLPAETDPLVYHNRAWHRLGDHSRIE